MELNLSAACEFISRAKNKLLLSPYHLPGYVWLDAKRNINIRPFIFAYEEKKNYYYHATHLMPIPNTPFFDLQSPYGYGGPLSSTEDGNFLKRALRHYLAYCRGKNVLVEFIRFHPLLDNWRIYRGQCYDNRQTVWIDLTSDLFRHYSGNTKTAIRKAKKNISIEILSGKEFHEQFRKDYLQTMREKHASAFYFFEEEYLSQLCHWEHSLLLGAYHQSQLLGMALFIFSQHFIEYHLSTSTPLGKTLSATNLLIHEALLIAQRKGCQFAHLGGGVTTSIDDSLLHFKRRYSNHYAIYKIGTTIYQPEIYLAMKKTWQKKFGNSERILFYRD